MNAVLECRADQQTASSVSGRFQPGYDPRRNAGGRPPGFKRIAQLADESAEAVFAIVLKAALGGDMAACRMILDRTAPAPRTRPVTFELPAKVTSPEGITAGVQAVLKAVSEGELTPQEAGTVADILELHRRSMATCEVEANRKNLLVQLNALRGPR